MSSVLVAVGCDRYDGLASLSGAEKDAADVFNALVSSGTLYRRESSHLLRSPSLAEFQATIRAVLASGDDVDVLTPYFAGHGGAKNGNYYICLRDSNPGQLSITALAVIQLFTLVNEVSPRQVNIVLDCCQSGSAMFELGAILRSAEVDSSAAATVSFLAATRANEVAAETMNGGVATRALLEAIKGISQIQSSRPYLDLIEVGRAVSTSVLASGERQTPISWGLNLYGEGRFAENPNYRSPGDVPLFAVERIAPSSPLGARIRQHSSELWGEYSRFADDPDPRRLQSILSSLIVESSEEEAASFATGFARALASRSRDSADVLAEPVAWGVVGIEMLRFGGATAEAVRWQLLSELVASSVRGRIALLASLRSNPRALLGQGGGLSNLYYLPLRVSRILGWVGSSLLVGALLGDEGPECEGQWASLIDLIVSEYSGSLVAVSDSQASWLHLFAAACYERKWKDRALAVLDPVFASLASVGGAVSKSFLPPDLAFQYLLARSQGAPGPRGAIARPIQLLPVVLIHGDRFGRASDWDPDLRSFDRTTVNLFVPVNYSDFGLRFIREGQNFTNTVGEGFWSLSEYVHTFDTTISRAIGAAAVPLSASAKALAVVASELFPDRVALFVPAAPIRP